MKHSLDSENYDPITRTPLVSAARLRAVKRERDELSAALDAANAANRRQQAEIDDLRLQCSELLRAVDAWHRGDYHAGLKLTDARDYCTIWTSADRARDAQERTGRAAAQDEAALRYGG